MSMSEGIGTRSTATSKAVGLALAAVALILGLVCPLGSYFAGELLMPGSAFLPSFSVLDYLRATDLGDMFRIAVNVISVAVMASPLGLWAAYRWILCKKESKVPFVAITYLAFSAVWFVKAVPGFIEMADVLFQYVIRLGNYAVDFDTGYYLYRGAHVFFVVCMGLLYVACAINALRGSRGKRLAVSLLCIIALMWVAGNMVLGGTPYETWINATTFAVANLAFRVLSVVGVASTFAGHVLFWYSEDAPSMDESH